MTELSGEAMEPALELAAERVRARLRAARSTVAIAETTCGGLVSYLVGDADDPADLVRVGIIAYSNDAKRDLADVPADILAGSGAVSRDVALALARGVRARWGADWGIAETGIAGPIGRRRSRKAAGTAMFAIVGRAPGADGPLVETTRDYASGLDDRLANKRAFALALLTFFADVLTNGPDGC